MYFVLSRVFTHLSSPGLHVFLLALWIAYRVWRRKRPIWALSALLVYLTLVLSPIPNTVWLRYEALYPPIKAQTQRPVAVVLMGGVATFDRSTELFYYAPESGRLLEAIRLYRRGVVKAILVSGVAPFERTDGIEDEALASARLARELGIPEKDIWIESRSRNTAENAIEVARLLKSKGIRDYYLVTSAYHMPRSIFLFKKIGENPTPYPVPTRFPGLYWGLHNLNFIPALVHEWAGLVVGR